MTNKEKEVLANFIKVARHARNYPHPQISIGLLKMEAVIAETEAERILGSKKYFELCDTAFKPNTNEQKNNH